MRRLKVGHGEYLLDVSLPSSTIRCRLGRLGKQMHYFDESPEDSVLEGVSARLKAHTLSSAWGGRPRLTWDSLFAAVLSLCAQGSLIFAALQVVVLSWAASFSCMRRSGAPIGPCIALHVKSSGCLFIW